MSVPTAAGPSITDAMKNYLAFRTAAALVHDEGALSEPGALQLQGMARALLAAVNSAPLPAGMQPQPGQTKSTKGFGRELLAMPGFDDVRVTVQV